MLPSGFFVNIICNIPIKEIRETRKRKQKMRERRLKQLWGKIKDEATSRKSPQEIALGIGIGSFLGVFPVQGFKTPLVFLIGSVCKKANIISIFTASTIFSLPFTFPFVYFFDYLVGCKLLKIPTLFSLQSFKDFSLRMLGDSLAAFFLGGAFVGILLGIVSYSLSFCIIKLKRKKKAK